MNELLDKLIETRHLLLDEWEMLISSDTDDEELFSLAREKRDSVYGRKVFLRALIEFTSICRNDCRYCGLRRSNRNAGRYRLTEEEILSAVDKGHDAGFRSFVLQGGEDGFFTAERMVRIIKDIKQSFPDSALTISIGELDDDSYLAMKNSGADRYLLRHETADPVHYRILHPESMSLENRKRCLRSLKRFGYQTGAGMMVGSPGSSFHTLAEDMVFISELEPEMVGIGPFIPHHDTPMKGEKTGSVELTLRMLALTRLQNPHVLLPSTTALGTADGNGQIKGLEAGANVIMPNITPLYVRSKYLLYDNKKISGYEAAENLEKIKSELIEAGYEPSLTRGDYI